MASISASESKEPPALSSASNKSTAINYEIDYDHDTTKSNRSRHLFGITAPRRSSAVTVITRDSFSSFSFTECCKYILFLVIFTLLMIVSRGDGVSNYYVTKNINSILTSNEFEKSQISAAPASFFDVAQISDIYDYIEKIFIPTMIIEMYANDSGIANPSDKNFVGLQNKLLGGFRIRQIRAKQLSCLHANIKQYRCFPNVYSRDKENVDKRTFHDEYKYESGPALGETESYHALLGTYSGGGHIADFPNNKTESLALIHTLKYNVSFFDQATRAIFIDFNTYNPSLNLHSVARMSFELPASGGVLMRSEIKTWRFTRYARSIRNYVIVLEVLFILCVLWFTMEEFLELKRQGLEQYVEDRWNILDWINLFVFYITIGWRIHQYSLIDDDKLYNVSSYVSLRDLQWSFQWENYIQMINGFLLWMKLFKYMTFSNRVRFLFTMLQRSSQDLLIFSIVLFVFFLAFGIAAFLSFSSDVSDFRSLSYAIVNLMRYTVTDLDYVSLRNSNRFLGNLYYVIWSILIILILSNVFIAILSEAYATISTEEEEEKIFDRLRHEFKDSIQTLKRHTVALSGYFFRAADSNKDGHLSKQEIAKAIHVKPCKAQQIIEQYDVNGDNQLSQVELAQVPQLQQLNVNTAETESEMDATMNRQNIICQRLDNIERLIAQLTQTQTLKESIESAIDDR
eukprot:236005_1